MVAKTTTLRILLGLVAPTVGTAHIDGHPYVELAHPLHEVGAVLEASGFYPGRTARDHLRILALAAGVDPSRAEDVLDLVRLSDAAGRRVGGFSLGMRQRLGLAGATSPESRLPHSGWWCPVLSCLGTQVAGGTRPSGSSAGETVRRVVQVP